MNYDEKKERLLEIAEIIKLYPDNLQEKVFNFLLADQNLISSAMDKEVPVATETYGEEGKTRTTKVKANSSSNRKVMPQFVKDLNLRPNNTKTLSEFIAEKQPKSNVQKTTVFTYYLQKILNIQSITLHHIFTCYKEIGARVSENLDQNIRDCASSKFGYIYYQKGICTMSISGDNLVEHDLPAKDKNV